MFQEAEKVSASQNMMIRGMMDRKRSDSEIIGHV